MKRPLSIRLVLLLLGMWLVGAGSEGAAGRAPAPAPLEGWISRPSRIVDLAYPLSEKNPAWPGDTRAFEAHVHARLEKDGYFSRRVCMLEHFSTHLDAPAHFAEGQASVEAIPSERLFGPAVVIDLRAQAAENADYRLMAADVQAWEERHGRIPAGAIVLAQTGWAGRWPDERHYRNQDPAGVMHFPGFSVEAARLLIERGVSGLGIDTLSVDYGASKEFEVHRLSQGAGLYHLENLADLSALPERGAFLIVAPLKLEGGSGGPARVFALLP